MTEVCMSLPGIQLSEMPFESYLGQFQPGDVVLDVRKMEPTSVGDSIYEFTNKEFPVFVENIRKRNMQEHLEELDTSRRSSSVASSTSTDVASHRKMVVLSPRRKTELFKLTAADPQACDRRELRQLGR